MDLREPSREARCRRTEVVAAPISARNLLIAGQSPCAPARPGGYGTLGGLKEGNNANVLGIRQRFQRSRSKAIVEKRKSRERVKALAHAAFAAASSTSITRSTLVNVADTYMYVGPMAGRVHHWQVLRPLRAGWNPSNTGAV